MSAGWITLLRPLVWLRRIRYRCGYGVHSPFAFNLITFVIYEKLPYYKYKELAAEEKLLMPLQDKGWRGESRKIKRLLFRLVNAVQPRTLVDAGVPTASSLYLQAGKLSARYIAYDQWRNEPVDFLYLRLDNDVQRMEQVFDRCANAAGEQSLFVLQSIGYNRAMRLLWERVKQDERVGITFDLYDLGLVFFNKKRIKQDYIVNF